MCDGGSLLKSSLFILFFGDERWNVKVTEDEESSIFFLFFDGDEVVEIVSGEKMVFFED